MTAAKHNQEHHEVVATYISELNRQFKTPKPTEHSYRPALQQLFDNLLPHLTASFELESLPVEHSQTCIHRL